MLFVITQGCTAPLPATTTAAVFPDSEFAGEPLNRVFSRSDGHEPWAISPESIARHSSRLQFCKFPLSID